MLAAYPGAARVETCGELAQVPRFGSQTNLPHVLEVARVGDPNLWLV
jgi:hypothetical protein